MPSPHFEWSELSHQFYGGGYGGSGDDVDGDDDDYGMMTPYENTTFGPLVRINWFTLHFPF